MDWAHFVLFRLFHMIPCRWFLDIGSRDALSAVRASRALPDARFICFEARRENYERILEDDRVDPARFRIEHLALTDHTGSVRFNVYENPEAPENRGLSSLKARKDLHPVRVEEVEAFTLDDYLANHVDSPEDLVLWIDVEGAAFEVLKGAEKSLANTNLIYVEVEVEDVFEETNDRTSIRRFLETHGFREILFRPHGSGEVGDSIFLPAEFAEALEVERRLRLWNVGFHVVAPFMELKSRLFEILSSVPFFLNVWRRIKPRSE